MAENLQDVRRDIESTRAALGDKIGRLENKIETTATTTLNPAYYVRTRPWPTLGIITAVGCLLGQAIKSRSLHKDVARNGTSERVLLVRDAPKSRSAVRGIVGMLAATFIRDLLGRRRRNPG